MNKRTGLKLWHKLVVGIGVPLLVIIIVFTAIPIKTVAYTYTEQYQALDTYYVSEPYTGQESYVVSEPYETTENYVEKVPYTRTETYVDREPYNRSVPVDYVVTATQAYSYFWSTGFNLSVWIKNADVKSGTFTVTYNVTLKGGARTTLYASQYIAISETKEVMASYSGAWCSSWAYSVTPPNKEVLDYRDVTKTRTVTDYRDETRTRTVTKFRNVTKYRDVIKYHDVPKERTVIKERPAAGLKKVTLLDALLHY